MEHFVLHNNQNTRRFIKYEDWLFINKHYIDNIIGQVLNELHKNSIEYKYEVNEEELINQLSEYLYETSSTKYKKVQFI
jgi:hypothetical protein|tara:strand:- start:1902 stop:2138 length:237 start_codon:yes stop_codon:yes gene_type:complete